MTTVIGVDDVSFRKDNQIVEHDRPDDMRRADSVSLTFRKQKNRDNGITVTQHRNELSGEDDLCPVRTLAEIVIRVRSYARKWTKERANVGINAFVSESDQGSLEWISSKDVVHQLRQATREVGEGRLGFTAESVGTHSLRSGAAMAMFLAGVPCETIQLIGRWRSQTFMRYIRIQVPESTKGVTTKMTMRNSFFTITADETSEKQTENGRNQVDTRKRTTQSAEREPAGEGNRTTRTRFRGH